MQWKLRRDDESPHDIAKNKIYRQTFHQQGVVFIHIPKNYGTTLMGKLFGTPSSNTHMTADQVNQIDTLKDFKTFCFVRDPIDRFVSVYSWRTRPKKEPENIVHRISLADTISMLTPETVKGPEGFDWEQSNNKLDRMFLSQTAWMNENTTTYRCENFEDEVKRAASDFGLYLPSGAHAMHKNEQSKVAKAANRKEFLSIMANSPDLKSRFLDFYEKDFVELGYSADLIL